MKLNAPEQDIRVTHQETFDLARHITFGQTLLFASLQRYRREANRSRVEYCTLSFYTPF